MTDSPPPPYRPDKFGNVLKDASGHFPDKTSAEAYATRAVQSEYGRDRARAVRSLTDELELDGAVAVDFGGGTDHSFRNSASDSGR